MKKLNCLLLIAIIATLSSCIKKQLGSKSSYSPQNGLASWYGQDFNGKKTASGETYNMNEFTAAHRYFPFGTKVKVTRSDTKKYVVVRINDRGPFVHNRIIDLSAAAAKSIDLDKDGVTSVKVERVIAQAIRKYHSPAKPSSFYLQVASFDHPKHAKDYAEYLSLLNQSKNIHVAYLNQHHKVWLGPYTLEALEIAQNQLKSNGIESVILRRS